MAEGRVQNKLSSTFASIAATRGAEIDASDAEEIVGAESELNELWAESPEYEPWRAVIDGLINAIRR